MVKVRFYLHDDVTRTLYELEFDSHRQYCKWRVAMRDSVEIVRIKSPGLDWP
ncbi:MAG: hypothetical protein K6T83_03755 [Alicyclobacillus sp.]|nr:hypothetical protein [Alicyclobacillus sp.]